MLGLVERTPRDKANRCAGQPWPPRSPAGRVSRLARRGGVRLECVPVRNALFAVLGLGFLVLAACNSSTTVGRQTGLVPNQQGSYTEDTGAPDSAVEDEGGSDAESEAIADAASDGMREAVADAISDAVADATGESTSDGAPGEETASDGSSDSDSSDAGD